MKKEVEVKHCGKGCHGDYYFDYYSYLNNYYWGYCFKRRHHRRFRGLRRSCCRRPYY